MNEPTYTGPALMQPNPFSRDMPEHVNAGTVMIEQERAIAEVKGKLSVAKMFPRNEALAFQKVMDSCSRPSLAKVAMYSFPRAGQTVSGPSIRLAEELARCWGNIDYGIRELSRKDGVSEMEAYAWDMETNTISAQRFSVRHVRDTRDGGKQLTDERDIYEMTANQGARRVRERIFAILPPDLIDAAVQKCRETLAGKSDKPIADRVRDMIAAFNKLGVTAPMIEKRLGRKLDAILPDDLVDLAGIYNSIKDGVTKPGDWFGGDAPVIAEPGAAPALPAAGNDNAQQAAARGARKAKAAEPSQPPAAPAEPPKAEQPEPAAAPAPTLAQPAAAPAAPAKSADLNDVF